MNEQVIWNDFLQGDKEALSSIFRTYHADLYNYGLKLVGNEEIVKDSIQEVFLKLWRNRENLSTTNKIKPYLLKSLRNHITNYLEVYNRYKFTDKPLSTISLDISIEDFNLENEVKDEILQKVLATLQQLSTRQREVIYLRYFEELEIENIAQIMEINEQSVRNTLHRAIQSLRENFVLDAFLLFIGKFLLD